MYRSTYQFLVRWISLAVILLATLAPNLTYAAQPQQDGALDNLAPVQQAEELAAYALQPIGASAQSDPQAGQSYAAANPAQALQIVFGPNDLAITSAQGGDLAWQLGLTLTNFGRQGVAASAVAAAATTAENNQIRYDRGQVSEWYVNNPSGLKQGFTLTSAPSAAAEGQPLQLWLAVGGTLRPQMGIDGSHIDFVTESGAMLLRYDNLVVYDANHVTLPAHFSTAGNSIVINIDDRGAAYPITVDPLLTNYLVKRTAVDAATDDYLGYDVNVSHGIAIVGMHGDDNELGVDAGTVLLYAQSQGGFNKWGQHARLTAADGAPGDQFGKDVYVHFGITVTVGAPGDDDHGTNAGAAYLFSRDFGGANAWDQLIKLTAADGAENDGFGSAVSLQKTTAVVGAPGKDLKGNNSGAVYVYELQDTGDPTSWVEVKTLTAPDGAAGDGFGSAVVNSEDVIVVGAPGDDDACPSDPECDAGAIYIFERNLGGANQWELRRKITAIDGAAGDRFGTSINISTSRIIVGAPGDDEKAVDAGAAYIFDRNLGGNDTWKARPKLMAPDGAANDRFGSSVGIGGNIAIVGAPFDDDGGNDTGSAYLVFFRGAPNRGAWSQSAKVIASDATSHAHFGASVDQRSGQIVIGAPDAAAKGAAYFYSTPFSVGTLQIASNVEPNDPNTNWEYAIDGILTHAESIGGDEQTAPALLFPGTYTITESAGANTNLDLYATSWSCTVNGSDGPSGSGSTATVFVGSQENVVCNFAHLRPGSIAITKQTKPDGATGFNFTDDIESPNSFTLDDDGTHTFANLGTGVHSVTETVSADWRLVSIDCQDGDGGSVVDGTRVAIDLDAGEAITCVYTNKAKDGITVIKSADVTLAAVGQTITYTYTVINDSQDSLTGITAVDDKLGSITLGKTTLSSGEETTGSKQYTVLASDLPGPLTNSVTVSGNPPSGPAVTDITSLSIVLVGGPSIALAVTTDPTSAVVEDTIEYSYWVTNTGESPLTNVQVVDDRLGEVSLTDSSLEPSESARGTLLYAVVAEDLPGPLTNAVTASGQPPVGAPVEANATVEVELSEGASIDVSVQASVELAQAGDTITYTYQITNSGVVTLANITATDDRLGTITLASTTLAPNESTVATRSYAITAADMPGPLANVVTATGKPSAGATVADEATVEVMLEGDDTSQIYLPRISP